VHQAANRQSRRRESARRNAETENAVRRSDDKTWQRRWGLAACERCTAKLTAPSRLPKRLVDFAPSICRRKSHIPQLDVIERGEKCALPHSRVPLSKQSCASSQRCRGQRTSAIRLCLHPGRGFPGEMTQRFVAMLGCGSCHIRGCHESCSLRFASSDPHSLLFASSDPQAVIVRHRPKRSRATTANADRLIAGCLITSAAPLRLLLSISKYLPYLTRPRGCARCLCCNRWTIRPPWVTFDRWTSE